MTVEHLARNMLESEFHAWQWYAARRMLPTRRMEWYLAQVALGVATTNGAHEVSLSDFMFDPTSTGEATVQDEIDFFEFKPRNLKQE